MRLNTNEDIVSISWWHSQAGNGTQIDDHFRTTVPQYQDRVIDVEAENPAVRAGMLAINWGRVSLGLCAEVEDGNRG